MESAYFAAAANRRRSVGQPYWAVRFGMGSSCFPKSTDHPEITVQFDPDKHRAHQTFESACLERYRTRSSSDRGSRRRAGDAPVAIGAAR